MLIIDDLASTPYNVVNEVICKLDGSKELITKKHIKSKLKKTLMIVIVILTIAVFVIFILDFITERHGVWKPNYPKLDLGIIVNKEEFAEEDYYTILMQTGLGRQAVDDLTQSIEMGLEIETIFDQYQDNFFSSGTFECRKIGVITSEERIEDKEGEFVKGFEIPSLNKGDILITKATHSLGWRHGHASIVTDASKGETLEAILWGYNSVLQNTEKWQTYPSFILLRLKNDTDGIGEEIADFAMKDLYDIPYGLLTGIPQKAPEGIEKTQCAHLVWYPYYHFGYDIDSDGSWLVTPKDIANSDLFEIVQVYGVNPEEIWP